MKFMQKYFHAGAFFTDAPDLVDKDLLQRDFTVSTGAERNVDKTLLPKVLQAKDFGKKSRTKCMTFIFAMTANDFLSLDTHLVDQDTTSFQANPWYEGQKMKDPSRYARDKSSESTESNSSKSDPKKARKS
jgi:hypothetical protein